MCSVPSPSSVVFEPFSFCYCRVPYILYFDVVAWIVGVLCGFLISPGKDRSFFFFSSGRWILSYLAIVSVQVIFICIFPCLNFDSFKAPDHVFRFSDKWNQSMLAFAGLFLPWLLVFYQRCGVGEFFTFAGFCIFPLLWNSVPLAFLICLLKRYRHSR